jgi:hypothetical protein
MEFLDINRQQQSFKTTIENLRQILGTLMVLEVFVVKAKEQIENDSRVGHDLIAGSLSFRDLTLNKDQANLYLTDSYVLGRSNLDEETDMILSRESLFQIAQAYELLETFLYDIVADLIFIKGGLNIFIDGNNSSDFHSIRKALKSLNDRQNNKHLINLIRANSESFNLFEKTNLYDNDFCKWFQILGDVRNCITHNRMVANKELKVALGKYLKDYIITAEYSNQEYLFATPTMCRNLLSRMADYIYFCYKSVYEASYDQKVDFQSIDFLLQGVYSQPE